VAAGAIENQTGKGKTIELTVSARDAKIQDLMRLAVKHTASNGNCQHADKIRAAAGQKGCGRQA
jgi:hypothetical protein